MSQSHSYRVQIHCDREIFSDIKAFAERRGLSQSAAARTLIERALLMDSDKSMQRFNRIDGYLDAILHAATVSRVLQASAAESSGISITPEELRSRTASIMARYKERGLIT